MSVVANISWVFVPGSTGTLIEYKESSSSTWLQPSSPPNPTLNNSYPITIDTNTYYDVRLTTYGATCTPRSTTFRIISAAIACCPTGYTLSEDGTYCYLTTTTAATPPSNQQTTVGAGSTEYGILGTLIYNPGYSNNGVGTFTRIDTSNAFWINNPINTTNGPNNRTALWAPVTTDNQDVGFSVCITVSTPGTYYIGCMADNYIIINIDGNNVLTMDPVAMGNYLSSNGFPGVGQLATFRFWHVYPVNLLVGSRVLEIIGHNINSIAGMGTEVYAATSGDLQAASSYTDLGPKLLFSSKDYIGQNIQIGSGGIGYTCPSGYSLVLCDGPAYCTQTEITPIISCGPTTTTTTTTSTSTSTTTSTSTSTSTSSTTTSTTSTSTSTSTSTTTSTSTSTTSTSTSTSTTSTTSSTTTTTTTFSGGNFIISNNRPGSTIQNVSPTIYFIVSGEFPVNSGEQILAQLGAGTTSFTVDTLGSGGTLNLYRNGLLQQSLGVTGGSTNFSPLTYLSTDLVEIQLT
jgi:hypothetical protein